MAKYRLFVMILIIHPSLLSLEPILGSSTSVEVSVNAQTAEPESGQRDIKFDIAQAPLHLKEQKRKRMS